MTVSVLVVASCILAHHHPVQADQPDQRPLALPRARFLQLERALSVYRAVVSSRGSPVTRAAGLRRRCRRLYYTFSLSLKLPYNSE